MEDQANIFPVVDWYIELGGIREELNTKAHCMGKMREMRRLNGDSPADMKTLTLVQTFTTLLLSYPVLKRGHLEEWEGFREYCCRLVEHDRPRCTSILKTCVKAELSQNGLAHLQNIEVDPYFGVLCDPFDNLDKVITMYDNKSKMPFSLLDYNNEMLIRVVETVKSMKIGRITRKWIKKNRGDVYPEVVELHRRHEGDPNWV